MANMWLVFLFLVSLQGRSDLSVHVGGGGVIMGCVYEGGLRHPSLDYLNFADKKISNISNDYQFFDYSCFMLAFLLLTLVHSHVHVLAMYPVVVAFHHLSTACSCLPGLSKLF